MNPEKILQTTLTGEPVQPIRLYYRLLNKNRFLDSLKRLRCMVFDLGGNRWVWQYECEAESLTFEKSYASIPKQRRPLIIGSFFLREGEAILDLRSFERAIKAVTFFDKHVGRDAVRLTHAAVVNRFFEGRERLGSNLDDFFVGNQITVIDPDQKILELEDAVKAHSVDGKPNLSAVWEPMAKRQLPAIEKFPVLFYDEGIASFENTLHIRTLLAFEHWKGNTDYSLYDLIKKILPHA